MPLNCKAVTLTEVIKFFVIDIDGMGICDGFLRNLGTPVSLEQCSRWKFCELTKEEFMNLTIPDGTNTLIKDKGLNTTEGDSRAIILRFLDVLKKNDEISPLIIRSKLPGESEDSSFYIEDGAHRAIALKIYFENNSYKAVRAYIGSRDS